MKGQLKIKTFAAQCALVVGMMGATNIAVGAPAYSSALVDWSTLNWSTTSGSLTWAGGTAADWAGVEIWQNGSSVAFDSELGNNANVSVANGSGLYAKGVANANKARAQASVNASGDESSAFAARGVSFFVGADTAVTFTVDYELFADVGSGAGMAESTVVFDLWNMGSGDNTWDEYFVDQIGLGSVGSNGTFSLTLNFLAGDEGVIYGEGWSNAVSVPAPGVLPLLGFGLLGLWGASRRRSV